jgi:GT2 family glycosyltransferase
MIRSPATRLHDRESVTPVVSVIVPALNSARTIGRCMAALRAQGTEHPFEVLVVHSGEDDTCGVARTVLPEVRTIQLPSRAVAARARSIGAGLARGRVLAFLDSDAYAHADWIDQVVRWAGLGYDLVCGSIANANPEAAVSRAEQLLMFSEFLPETPSRPMGFALAGNLVMPRETYARFGPFIETRAAEDMLFSRRLALAGGRIVFAPSMCVSHDNRRHLRTYLRNQVLLGKHTAIARRVVPFADSRSQLLFFALLPIAPAAKLGKVVWRLARWCPRQLAALVRELPLVLLGALGYGAGQVVGAFTPKPVLALGGRMGTRRPSSAAVMSARSQAASWATSNSRSTVARPAAAKRARKRASSRSAEMARSSAPASAGGTTEPDTPSSTSSDTPATPVATTGTPEAIASINTTGTPSAKLGKTKTSLS